MISKQQSIERVINGYKIFGYNKNDKCDTYVSCI